MFLIIAWYLILPLYIYKRFIAQKRILEIKYELWRWLRE